MKYFETTAKSVFFIQPRKRTSVLDSQIYMSIVFVDEQNLEKKQWTNICFGSIREMN